MGSPATPALRPSSHPPPSPLVWTEHLQLQLLASGCPTPSEHMPESHCVLLASFPPVRRHYHAGPLSVTIQPHSGPTGTFVGTLSCVAQEPGRGRRAPSRGSAAIAGSEAACQENSLVEPKAPGTWEQGQAWAESRTPAGVFPGRRGAASSASGSSALQIPSLGCFSSSTPCS